MSSVKIPEPFRDAGKAARKARWSVTRTKGSHLKWKPPAGQFIITPSTPGDPRGIRNSLSALRAAGLEF